MGFFYILKGWIKKSKVILKFFVGLIIGIVIGLAFDTIIVGIGVGIGLGAAFSQKEDSEFF